MLSNCDTQLFSVCCVLPRYCCHVRAQRRLSKRQSVWWLYPRVCAVSTSSSSRCELRIFVGQTRNSYLAHPPRVRGFFFSCTLLTTRCSLHRHVAHALTLDCGDTCLDFALRLFTSLASVHAFKERVYRQGAAALWALAHRFDSESLLTSTLFGIGNCASSATNARLIAAQANERVPLLMHIMALAPPNAKRPSAVGAAYVLGQAAYADPLGFASADASVFDAIVSHSRANVEPGSSLFSSFWLLWSAAHWLNGRSDAGAAETFCQLDIQFQALHSVRSSLPCLWSTLNGLFALIRSRRTSSFGLWTLHSVALAEEHRPKLLNPNNVTHLFAALRVLDGSLPAIDAHLHPVWALLSQSADAAFLARARRELSAEDWLRLRLDCSSSCL